MKNYSSPLRSKPFKIISMAQLICEIMRNLNTIRKRISMNKTGPIRVPGTIFSTAQRIILSLALALSWITSKLTYPEPGKRYGYLIVNKRPYALCLLTGSNSMHIINICREIPEIPNPSKSARIAGGNSNSKTELKLDVPIIAVIAKLLCSERWIPVGFPNSDGANRFLLDSRG